MTERIKKLLTAAKSIIVVDPHLLYTEERHLINEPFFFPGTNGKGVLLVHGWTSTPYEVRRLGRYLNESGYTVSGILLRGHGTVPKDLEEVRWTDWLEDVERGFDDLIKRCHTVYVGGTSIGSSLAIMLASKNPGVAGLVLMATPYRFRIEPLVIFTARLVSRFSRYRNKFYPPTFGLSTTITRLISYQSYPIKSALETFELVKESRRCLRSITCPSFVIQSGSDHLMTRDSIDRIYDSIASARKQKKIIERAYHTFISDIKNEHVFEEILDFIEETE